MGGIGMTADNPTSAIALIMAIVAFLTAVVPKFIDMWATRRAGSEQREQNQLESTLEEGREMRKELREQGDKMQERIEALSNELEEQKCICIQQKEEMAIMKIEHAKEVASLRERIRLLEMELHAIRDFDPVREGGDT
jgi:TolA-binding protein